MRNVPGLIFTACLLLDTLGISPVQANELPNILWITSEDNSASWIGCYGNAQASTPSLDEFARNSIRFSRCYSNAPVCAVARSTLLNGVHAVTQGTQHMRSRYSIPESFRPYVSYLRERGYHCTNNRKTDFNIAGDDKAIWDECSGRAHYKNCPAGKPFFSIFNLTLSHESSLFPDNLAKSRASQLIPPKPRLDPGIIKLPPYVPDLPEIRHDFASYYDVVSALDERVGRILKELEESGLAENTIVFYFSDHGGPTPRGKRYLEDSGVHIPLIIRIPERWKSLSPFAAGSTVDELVAFVDFAPTLLSLAGLEIPDHMQGRAFLGRRRVIPDANARVFLFADRFDTVVGMRRGISDGQFKYIRRFYPWMRGAPFSDYPLQQAGWRAWQDAALANRLNSYVQHIWTAPQATESLFDLHADPSEIDDLAGNPDYADILVKMRGQLLDDMAGFRDTGLVPEGLFSVLSRGRPLADALNESGFDFHDVGKLAFDINGDKAPKVVRDYLNSDDPVKCFWAVQGCISDSGIGRDSLQTLRKIADSDLPVLRISAAHALFAAGEREAGAKILRETFDMKMDEANSLLLANTLSQLELEGPRRPVDRLPD